jgi:preprotein translocase subunit Sec61beta
MSIPKHFAASALLVLGLQSVAASGADLAGSLRPEAVSPGRLDRIVEMADGCFGYSWSAVEGARGFELAVHRLDGVAANVETAATPALSVRVPATFSWTPSLEECLPPGRYAWVVRAQIAAGWTEWSEPRLFRVRRSAPDAPLPGTRERSDPANAASRDGQSQATSEFQARASRLFTAAPQGPRSLTRAAFSPPSCDGTIFSDVTGDNPNCAWIEQLAADEIAQPCADGPPGSRRYCPDHPVTRGQIATLLEHAMRGTDTWRAEQGDGAVPNLPPALPSSNAFNLAGWYSAITTGADGLGLISFYDAGSGFLRVAHCSNIPCSAATVSPVDATGLVGQYSSITIGADGRGLISYYDVGAEDLKAAHCSDPLCTAATKTSLDVSEYNVGKYTSITTGADGLGLISYYDFSNSDLRVAHCSDVLCTAATATRIDGFPGVMGQQTSITIGADGLGLVSYWDSEFGDLRVAHCSNPSCTAARVTLVDGADFVGQYTSITIGADGLGLISYYDETNFDLKVAHCSNVLCAPYFRRR